MSIIAYAGEQFMGRDGKVITVAQDITSGDINLRPSQFVMADGTAQANAPLPEEVYEFIRNRLSSPPPQDGPKYEFKHKAKAEEPESKAKKASKP